jgi:hypothetical protein
LNLIKEVEFSQGLYKVTQGNTRLYTYTPLKSKSVKEIYIIIKAEEGNSIG